MEEPNYPLVAIIPDIEDNGVKGFAKVYDCEDHAEAMLPIVRGNHLICCAGYYNAVFVPYRQQ